MNNKYEIEIKHPFLRPGITIRTEASEDYVVPVTLKAMELARTINKKDKERKEQEAAQAQPH